MSLILRIDIDKPYGRTTFRDKVLSKLREDYWLPPITFLGYLNPTMKFLFFLAENNIKAHIYFRTCTLPPKCWFEESLLDGHMLGLHAENTRNFDTFKEELEKVQNYMHPIKLSSFNKHGSGVLKLGRNHYPPYEPEKYLKWAEMLNVPFLFGNNEMTKGSIPPPNEKSFYPSMFWIDRAYSASEQITLQQVVDIAKNRNVVVIIHPDNFVAMDWVERDMRMLVSLSQQNDVSWVTIK